MPDAGRVKTRLVPPLSHEEAAELYAASLRDVVARAGSVGADLLLFVDPSPGAVAYFESEFPGLRAEPQRGVTLGERLADAFDRAFARGYPRAMIIGADSPTLPRTHLEHARKSLDTADVVFGPAEDGGYYLVGIRASAWPAARPIFDRIDWSTAAVLEQSLAAAEVAHVEARLGPEWYDIDRPRDLRRAAQDAAPGSHLEGHFARHPAVLGKIAAG